MTDETPHPYTVNDEGAIELTPGEIDALAEWLCNRFLGSDWMEWADVPFLAEHHFERLCDAANDYIARLHAATREWTAEWSIDPARIENATNADPALSGRSGQQS